MRFPRTVRTAPPPYGRRRTTRRGSPTRTAHRTWRIAILPTIALLLGTGPSPGASHPVPAAPKIEDIFGRSLDDHGLVLVDWEGYIANPAIQFVLVPPPDATYPARIIVRAREPRLYFVHRAGPRLRREGGRPDPAALVEGC